MNAQNVVTDNGGKTQPFCTLLLSAGLLALASLLHVHNRLVFFTSHPVLTTFIVYGPTELRVGKRAREGGRETERPTVGQSVDDCSVKGVTGAKCVHQRFWGEGLRPDQNPVWTQRCRPCLCPGTHQDGPKGATEWPIAPRGFGYLV